MRPSQEVILAALAEYWAKFPELRLGQIVSNMTAGDPFYVSDEDMLANLQEQARVGCLHPGTFRGTVCARCGVRA